MFSRLMPGAAPPLTPRHEAERQLNERRKSGAGGYAASARPRRRGFPVELSVLMPCLNEAETVATCVHKAKGFLADNGIDGEVLVADNGSTDGSQALAEAAGARVVPIAARGYGNALRGGIKAARSEFVIMGDADDSYDFTALMPFLERLRAGDDLVMGNRFAGGIAPGAMPALHRYLGNPVLSFVGRLFFNSKVGDFHCGLRGFRRDSALSLDLQADGMEFASEMVVRSTLAGQQISEVPTTLSPDGRSRPPHLRSWRDGWRHLRFLLLLCPRWLYGMPGLVLILLGLLGNALIVPGPLRLGRVTFDVDTLVGAEAMIIIGMQSVFFAVFTVVYTSAQGLRPEPAWLHRLRSVWTLERGLAIGALLAVGGLAGVAASFLSWHGAGFGSLDYDHELRIILPSATALIISCQVALGTFFLGVLEARRPTATDHSDAPREAGPGQPEEHAHAAVGAAGKP
jgi:Glycosyl transferase family 2